MSQEIFLKAFIACLIGNIIHVAIRCVRLQKEMKQDKTLPDFEFKKWLKSDKWVLLLDVVGSFGIVYAADEWLIGDIGRIAQEHVKTLFIFIGIGGSSLIVGAFSNFREKMKSAGIPIPLDDEEESPVRKFPDPDRMP